jgi:hypothetical protein
MSRFIKILQKLNFIDQDSEDDKTILAFNSFQGTVHVDVPKNIYFITPRIILIPYPKEEIIEGISGYLNTFYFRKYMVWNLSEHLYSSDIFNGQVLDFVFVGYPNPPLNEVFGIFNSISGWLESGPDNVAVVHCQSTCARSYFLISSYLAWQNRKDPLETFKEISKNIQLPAPLLFPSHIRYMSYISEIIQDHKVNCK